MKIWLVFFVSFVLFLNFSCIAFPGKIQESNHFQKVQVGSVKLVFTGFTKYSAEEVGITQTLANLGINVDPNADTLLEVILEELEPDYDHGVLHFLHLFVYIGTISIIPYHNQTNHRLTYRIRKANHPLEEVIVKTRFHQWRGISLIPFSYFYWPTNEFTDFLNEITNKEISNLQ